MRACVLMEILKTIANRNTHILLCTNDSIETFCSISVRLSPSSHTHLFICVLFLSFSCSPPVPSVKSYFKNQPSRHFIFFSHDTRCLHFFNIPINLLYYNSKQMINVSILFMDESSLMGAKRQARNTHIEIEWEREKRRSCILQIFVSLSSSSSSFVQLCVCLCAI